MTWRTKVALVASAAVLATGTIAAWPTSLWATAGSPTSGLHTDTHPRPTSAQPLVVQEVLSGESVIMTASRPGAQISDWGTVTVRLLGIDAPNFGWSRECYANESEAALRDLLPEGSIAWVTTDELTQDEGGRWLGYVWSSDGFFVNEVLVSTGMVTAYLTEPNSEYWSVIAQGAEEAWRRSAGLWSDCS